MAESPKKSPFQWLHSAKARVFLTLALVVVVIGIVAFVMHWHNESVRREASASVVGAPNIASTPGAGDPSAAYVKAQTESNQAAAEAAKKAGTAFVPTIVRPGFEGNPGDFQTNTQNGLHCPINKTVVMYKPNPANCALDNLQRARESGVTAEELVCQGCACPVLKAAGYTVGDLKSIGLTAKQLRACGFTLQALINAGFDAADLKDAGYSATELKNAGFSAAQLNDAGFTAANLKAAGYSDAAIQAATSTGVNCNVAALKADRAKGMSAAQIKAQGCGVAALKAAGFSAADLKAAGFSAAQLKAGGFSAAQLKAAGFSAAQLKEAGFSAGALVAAGFSPTALKDAGFSAAQLRTAGVSAAALKAAGFTSDELQQAGFTKGDLLRAGFSPEAAGYQETVAAAPTTVTPSTTAEPVAGNGRAALPSIADNSREGRLAAFEKQQQADMNAQQRANQVQRMQAMMEQQAQKLMSGWSNVPNQQMQKAPEEKPSSAITVAGSAGAAAKDSQAVPPGASVLKAGTVLFAVIDSSINSDVKSPILARIVAGPMEGARLMGSFTREHKELLIRFTLLNDPHYVRSLPLDAVAIDANTARTALSGQVNSHYLLRYGTLFAASFLQGVSQAIINQGVTSDCLFGGFGCTLQQTPLNTNQQIAVGLGQVGQAYAQYMGKNFNRPPTVRIAAGTGVGVLLMNDLVLPANPKPVHRHDDDYMSNE